MAVVKNITVEALERHCSSGETGRLDFVRGTHEGQIFTHDHFLVHAQLSGLEGVPALFQLLDWGDAETTWNPGLTVEKPTLHLDMDGASILYAEYLQERSVLEPVDKEGLEQAFVAPDLMGNIESVLKYYTLSLESSDPTILPGGFVFSDTAKTSYVIGNSEDCDVIVSHASIDPLHCGVILEKGSVYIWDLGSQAGIKLNGTPIAEATLKVGDVMKLGSVDLHVRFHLRRPKFNRPQTATVPAPEPTAMPGAPPKHLPKGAIIYDKVTRQLKDTGKAKPFLAKLGSLFGTKERK